MPKDPETRGRNADSDRDFWDIAWPDEEIRTLWKHLPGNICLLTNTIKASSRNRNLPAKIEQFYRSGELVPIKSTYEFFENNLSSWTANDCSKRDKEVLVKCALRLKLGLNAKDVEKKFDDVKNTILGEGWMSVNRRKIFYNLNSRWTRPADPAHGYEQIMANRPAQADNSGMTSPGEMRAAQ